MLMSMTGFGRAVADTSLGQLIVEVQSVNRKYLDINLSLPKEFSRFEYEVRKWVGEQVLRGQISIRIYLVSNSASVKGLLPDVAILQNLKKEWEQIARALGSDPKQIDLPFLMTYFPLQQKIEFANDHDFIALEQCVKEALGSLVQMKLREGEALAADIAKHFQTLRSDLDQIESLAPEASKKMKEKLVEKLGEVKGTPDLDDRILREVLLYAERVDIAEEITRLRSHFHQFIDLLQSDKMVGRKMDFLVQEMGREINTIGAKSAEIKISHLVVAMKSKLEQVREQVQNIE